MSSPFDACTPFGIWQAWYFSQHLPRREAIVRDKYHRLVSLCVELDDVKVVGHCDGSAWICWEGVAYLRMRPYLIYGVNLMALHVVPAERRNGHATRILQALQRLADTVDVDLLLFARPFTIVVDLATFNFDREFADNQFVLERDPSAPDAEQLTAFYQRLGFSPSPGYIPDELLSSYARKRNLPPLIYHAKPKGQPKN